MRAATIFFLLLTVPALAEESVGNTNGRTEIDGSYRINTYNGVKVWRPFPPAPAPLIVRPPPPTNIVINQTAAPAVEPTYVLPVFGPRLNRYQPIYRAPRSPVIARRFNR